MLVDAVVEKRDQLLFTRYSNYSQPKTMEQKPSRINSRVFTRVYIQVNVKLATRVTRHFYRATRLASYRQETDSNHVI